MNPFGYGRILPRGLLREPLKSCSRAQFAVFTRADAASKDRLRDLEDTIRCNAFGGEIAHCAHVPSDLIGLNTSEEFELSGSKVAAICGIGNPRGFEATLQQAGAEVTDILALDDHAEFSSAELSGQVIPFIQSQYNSGAAAVIVTQKDAVKLRAKVESIDLPIPMYELRVELSFMNGEEKLKAIIRQTLND